MICLYCKKENRVDSKFCRFCGKDLSVHPMYHAESAHDKDSHFQIRIPEIRFQHLIRFFQRVSLKNKHANLLVIMLLLISVYAVPKVNSVLKVRVAIKHAIEKQDLGEYKAAIGLLGAVETVYSLESQKREITTLMSNQERFISYEQAIASSTKKENSKDFKNARELLQLVGTDYPKYESYIKPKLSELQDKIEKGLEAQARAATAARVEAEKKAQAAAEAKAHAEEEASMAAEAKARSDAAAAVSAEQARQAEYQRQQEEIRKAVEIKKSFINELITGYNSYNQGASYYSSAISYSNSSESILAISQANSAKAVLNTARNGISDLNARFTGLPPDYYTAANNMIHAIDNLNNALDLLVQSEATSIDSSATINGYKDLAVIYASRVRAFLDSI